MQSVFAPKAWGGLFNIPDKTPINIDGDSRALSSVVRGTHSAECSALCHTIKTNGPDVVQHQRWQTSTIKATIW